MTRKPVVASLYGAVFDLSTMRDEVEGFGDAADAAGLMSRLEHLEAKALLLIDQVESEQRITAH